MRIVDDALLADVSACIPREPTKGPHFDLEVIAAPFVDPPEAATVASRPAMIAAATERLRALRARLGSARRCGLLLAIGDADDERLWLDAYTNLGERVITAPAAGLDDAVRVVVHPIGDKDGAEILAYIAVVALSPRAPLNRAQSFLRALATAPERRNTPLYVIGVEPNANRIDDVERWQRLGASVVLCGPSARRDVRTIDSTVLDGSGRHTALAVVPCPAVKSGEGSPGIARLRLDVWLGQAEIALAYDLGSDLRCQPVQTVRPLTSVSRVDAGEQRLRHHVDGLVRSEHARRARTGEDTTPLQVFDVEVAATWDARGYVTLCTEDGRLAGIPPERFESYLLLVLMRETADGGRELLLSNHSPVRASALGEWNSLLLPAFRHPGALLGHLRDDVLRQAFEQGENLQQAERAREFEAAVERILCSEPEPADVWMREVREVATLTTRKISPTTGQVTEFEYHFVTLMALVDRRSATGSGIDDQGADARSIVRWLEVLERVGSEGLPLAAVQADGAGLRSEPLVDLASDPPPDVRERARRLPPGLVWFPLEGEAWRSCPSVVARNADVMAFVTQRLAKPPVPSHVLLGRFIGGQRYTVAERHGFAAASEALRNVRFAERSDLRDVKAYPDAQVEPVYLVRRPLGARSSDRDVILVVRKERFESRRLRHLVEADALGRLRPVQRYVVTAGLERAAELDALLLANERAFGDPWGFVRVQHAGAGLEVSLTPPIVERVTTDDEDGLSEREFLVVDGNHRVVQRVWRERRPLEALAVLSRPAQPYYAYPFDSREWDVTSRNELRTAPAQDSKYAVRRVSERDVDADAWREIKAMPESQRYRRYFRDLASTNAFGYMGGQAGREAL